MKKTSDYVEQWRKELPRLKALAPYGTMRANLRFRLVPINPNTEQLHKELCQWALEIGLCTPDTVYLLEKSRVGYVAYWVMPLGSLEVARLVGKLFSWVIIMDETHVELGRPVDELQRVSDDVLRSGKTTAAPSPTHTVMREVREQIIAADCDGLLPQIADKMWDLFDNMRQEQDYLQRDYLPGLQEYLAFRTVSIALEPAMVAQRCEKYLLPHDQKLGERLANVAQLALLAAGLNNDIVGIEKDIQGEFPMNVVPVLAVEFNVDLPTAYLMSLDLLDIVKQLLDMLVADVCLMPGLESRAAAQALALQQWPDGLHTWHTLSPRHSIWGGVPDEALVSGYPLGNVEQGALLEAVRKRLVNSPTNADNTHIGATGLGTSALRLASSLNEAEMLRDWVTGLLGRSTTAEPAALLAPAAPTAAVAAVFAEIRPTGVGTVTTLPSESIVAAASSVSAAAPVEIRPTGVGTATALIQQALTVAAPSVSAPVPLEIRPGGVGTASLWFRDRVPEATTSPTESALDIAPAGVGDAAAMLAALATTAQSNVPNPADVSGGAPLIPGLTGLGTSATNINALLNRAPA